MTEGLRVPGVMCGSFRHQPSGARLRRPRRETYPCPDFTRS